MILYTLMTCWSLMRRRESGTKLDQCLPRQLDMHSQSSTMRTLRLTATENCFCKYYGYFIFEKFILYFNVTYYPQFNKMYYMLVKLHSNPLCLLKALCRAAISIYVLQSIFTDLINYRIDLDRKMSGWVIKGSAKEYSDEL